MRLLRRTLRGLAGSRGLHLLTLSTVCLSFLVVGTLALIYLNLERAMASWQSQFRVVVVLRPGVGDEGAYELRGVLAGLPGVAGAEYVDSGAALDALSERLGHMDGRQGPGRARLLELLSDNPLPSTFRLRVRPDSLTPQALRALAGRAQRLPGVAEVRYGEAWVARFYSFFRLFKYVATISCGLLFVTATFIISAQIRLVLALRRDEIGLLRLLGAGDFYLGAPYVVEGALIGMGGAALAAAALLGLYRLLVVQAGTEIEPLLSASSFLPPTAILALVGFGAAVGVLGSLVSLRRLA